MSPADALSDLGDRAQAKVDAELAGVKAKHPSSDGLRQLADWLDKAHANGVTPLSQGCTPSIYFWGGDKAEDVRSLAAQLGTFEKKYDDYHFTMSRDFGGAVAKFLYPRSTVCKRVVTGTKTLPAVTIPAKPAEPERVIPEQTIETVEWECGESLLAKTFDELETAND